MSLIMKKTLDGGARRPTHVLLDDSKTMAVGQACMSYTQTDDVITYAAAAAPILGIIVGIVDKYCLPIPGAALAAGTAGETVITSIATAANNTTTKLYWALVDTGRLTVYSSQVSGTLGTTNQSNKRGCKIDIDSANTNYARVLESTATRTVGTPANFYSHGLDKDISTRLLLTIALSELDSDQE